MVDRIDDAQEIVVRPLARQLKGISCLAGATIMGDGSIALILDVFGLARGLDGRRDDATKLPEPDAAAPAAAEPPVSLVVLRGTDGSPMAIPLAEVERLETFPGSSIQWIADRAVVPYRQALLPLVDVAARLRGDSRRPTDADDRPWQVVVHLHEGKRLGLVFGRVLDVVEQHLDVRGEANRPGVRLTAVVQGTATEILDVAALRASPSADAGPTGI